MTRYIPIFLTLFLAGCSCAASTYGPLGCLLEDPPKCEDEDCKE